MEHLARYWNAMAVRRNQKTACWWVPEEPQVLRQEGGAVLDESMAQDAALALITPHLSNGTRMQEEI